MKKIVGLLLIVLWLFLVMHPVIAGTSDSPGLSGVRLEVGHADNDTGQNETPGQQKKEDPQASSNVTGSKGTEQLERQEVKVEVKSVRKTGSDNLSEIKEHLHQEQETMNATLQNETPVRRGWLKNVNEVRLAVHTLLAMENITGGIGPYVSAIARDFNNSVEPIERLEERIQTRDTMSRLLFGGDAGAAAEIANLTVQNRVRIQEMQHLMANATLDTETIAIIKEQLSVMEREQTRLQELALKEQQDNGIFGWIFKK
jgi:hypothetical protein